MFVSEGERRAVGPTRDYANTVALTLRRSPISFFLGVADAPGSPYSTSASARPRCYTRLANFPAFTTPPLHHGDELRAILEDRNIREHVALDDQPRRRVCRFERADLVVAAEDLGAGLGRADQRLHRGEATCLTKKVSSLA